MINIKGYTSRGQPDVAWWMEQIRSGIEWRKKCAHQPDWDKWRKWYRGDFPRGVLPVNLFFRMLRTTVPRIYFRNPSISVVPTKPGIEQAVFAELIERIDNKLVRTMDVKNGMKRIIHNAWMFGTGAGKLGFGSEFKPNTDLFNTEAPEEHQTKFTRRIEYNQNVEPNMPWFMSVHTGSLIVPKNLMNFSDTPWVAMWLRRSIDDVQSDPRLKNAKDLKASTNKGLGGVMGSPTDTNSNKPNEIDLVEIRDMRTRKAIIIAPFATDRILFYDDDDLQNNNRPNIYPIVFNPDDEYFWGIPDSVILEPQQLEINEIRTLQMKHRRISMIKLLIKKGSVDFAEIEKMLNGDVGSAILVNGELSDVEKFELGMVPESLYTASAEVQADVRDSMGFSRNQGGEYASQKSHNAPTAIEARIVQAASEIRVDERRDALADVLVDVFEDANELCFNKWQDEQVVQVMGPDAIPVWVAFKPAMLKAARYEINIEPDSTLPETKDMREAKASQVYQLLKPNPLIDPTMLTRYLLREMHGVQYDNMMKQVTQNAAAGAPGSAPDQPMGSQQYMQMLARSGQKPPNA